eukprot:TRINITY_DN5806_c0_g2_i4.p1 TRINITY_DN5806_c0_g2~~TRINITY_DN5806_c0_g2_i4.p1  ORF type:complete len:184 (+),score=27.57 TRINITY_DN5806_c0_g2_i4:599-1150(+)
MFGRKAVELIRELDRTDDDQLLPYNVDVIEEALKEVAEHNSQLSKVLQKMRQERALGAAAGEAAGAADSAAILVHHRSILRNKRCIMAYLHHRMKKINALRWQLGGRLPEEIAGKLSQSEVEAYNAHCKCLADYMDAVLVDLNVVGSQNGPIEECKSEDSQSYTHLQMPINKTSQYLVCISLQ